MLLHPPVPVALASAASALPPGLGDGRHEASVKWDGWRALVFRDEREVMIQSRSGRDLTALLPDLVAAVAAEVPAGVVLDGEIVATDSSGQVSFAAMQRRGLADPHRAAGLARQLPVAYAAFDVLEAAGRDRRPAPLAERAALLRELLPTRPGAVVQPVASTNDSEVMLQWLRTPTPGTEGIVLKRATAPYRAGRRSDWLKIKRPNARQ